MPPLLSAGLHRADAPAQLQLGSRVRAARPRGAYGRMGRQRVLDARGGDTVVHQNRAQRWRGHSHARDVGARYFNFRARAGPAHRRHVRVGDGDGRIRRLCLAAVVFFGRCGRSPVARPLPRCAGRSRAERPLRTRVYDCCVLPVDAHDAPRRASVDGHGAQRTLLYAAAHTNVSRAGHASAAVVVPTDSDERSAAEPS